MAQTNTALLTWNANTEIDLFGYHVYWGLYPGTYTTSSGALAASVTTFTASGTFLPADGLWYFAMDAFDTSLNTSAKTAPISKRIIRTSSKLVLRR